MSLIAFIVLGLVAGWLAGMLMRGGGYGIIGDIILGILGALIGGWITAALTGVNPVNGLDVVSIIVSVVGACVLIALSRLFTGRTVGTHA